MQLFTIFFLLLCGHAVADFALQNEWVATNKNRHVRDKFTAEQKAQFQIVWPWLLSAHCFHHGLMVFLATQKIELAVAETVAHAAIDYGKTENWYGFHADQILHLITKIIWVALIGLQVV